MNKEYRDTLTVRIFSSVFVTLALAVFKPFGLEEWQWQAYGHLLIILAIGIGVCLLTEGILRYVLRMPHSYNQGVGYIIHRNLWFQIINTPLVALAICLYRHFVLSHRVESNLLSWGNFFETLIIIAFCSFAIGLYWRFRFRSRYLASELEETKSLNEQLKLLQQESERRAANAEAAMMEEQSAAETQTQTDKDSLPATLVLAGTTSEAITLSIPSLLYIESVGNYVKVYQQNEGQVRFDMIRTTTKQVEDTLKEYPTIVRCHRAFLVNLQQVEQIVSKAGSMQLLIKHCHEYLPVSRSNMAQIKDAIKRL